MNLRQSSPSLAHPIVNIVQLFRVQDEFWETNHVVDCICLWKDSNIQTTSQTGIMLVQLARSSVSTFGSPFL